MPSSQAQPRRQEARLVEAVSLVAGTDRRVFPVTPKPFLYRDGMRLRIDVIGGQAFVAEIP